MNSMHATCTVSCHATLPGILIEQGTPNMGPIKLKQLRISIQDVYTRAIATANSFEPDEPK